MTNGLIAKSDVDNSASEFTHELAIVVPAFRARYLSTTMNSLVNQTVKDFVIQVFDDASPEDLRAIISPFTASHKVAYYRFEDNLGGKSLARHWNRCVNLVSARYIWIVSDDDIIQSTCVESFFAHIKSKGTATRLLRFNTSIIDKFGHIESISPPHPRSESSIEFTYHRMMGKRDSCVSNYVFSMNAFRQSGGFFDLPLAWYSDDASWALFAGDSPIETIEGPKVYYRANSGINISSANLTFRQKKLEALVEYALFLEERYSRIGDSPGGEVNWLMLSGSMPRWLYHNVTYLGGIPVFRIPNFAKRFRAILGGGMFEIIWRLILCSFFSLAYRFASRIKRSHPRNAN